MFDKSKFIPNMIKKLAFGAARKSPRIENRKRPNIKQYGVVCDLSIPGVLARSKCQLLNHVRYIFFSLFVLSCVGMAEAQQTPFMMDNEDSYEIIVNNRVLANVNNKPITVVDVMKKMDMIFYREYPEYTSIKAARFQFYMNSWKHVLQDLIDKDLVLADAEEAKLTVNNGEVRQEMEHLFGPNIIANLDKAGLTIDEASKMVHNDIAMRRMFLYRVNSKAMRQVNPQDVRIAYEQYLKDHVRADEWVYNVVSVRGSDEAKSSNLAKHLYKLLSEQQVPLESVQQVAKEALGDDLNTTVNISSEFRHKEKDVSPAFKEILITLQPGTFSAPIAQKSRNDKSTVYRIFYLKDKVTDDPASFQEIAAKLKEDLIQKAIDVETQKYLDKLRQHFAIEKEQIENYIPEDFQPFILQSQRLN